jgi:hypothetical protein
MLRKLIAGAVVALGVPDRGVACLPDFFGRQSQLTDQQ